MPASVIPVSIAIIPSAKLGISSQYQLIKRAPNPIVKQPKLAAINQPTNLITLIFLTLSNIVVNSSIYIKKTYAS